MQLTISLQCAKAERIWLSLRRSDFFVQAPITLPRRSKTLSSLPCIRAYLETNDPIYDFFNKVRGSLPVIGLLTRILSDDGGVGSDRIQFKEFCTRVYRNFTFETSQAFYDLEQRHGSAARPQYVLLWCWAAALGAGLLKSEDLMMSATRLSATYDIAYEEENLNLLMDEASKKRKKSNSPVPFVPYEARAEKALDAICKCCISKPTIDEEDAVLLTTILQGVFPGGDKNEIETLVRIKLSQTESESTESSDKGEEYNDDSDMLDSGVTSNGARMHDEQHDELDDLQPEERSSSPS
ncbi:hypothetical protein KP509_01G110900 [Ceratopteris richardii]|uniref:Uncharacterized protein n=1 Tax=Ceratopteris richardii TaxID=49495 RepID=A0A8T2VJW7_CERRI|nr:hypothetical protein KP509_01G110900 [Ceratopteris richardii]